MAVVCVISAGIAYLALLALCAFYAGRLRQSSALAPLLAVSTVMLVFSLAGVLNLLVVAGWLFYAACFALLGLTLVKTGWKKVCETLCTPGFLLFAGMGLVALVYLGVRQPVFLEWDEFSLWGTGAKLMKLNNELYSTANVGWTWTATQRPGLFVLGYFTQFFAGGFAAWKVYFGYDLLLFACAAALTAPFENIRQWRTALPLAGVGLLLPFFFSTGSRLTSLATPYISSYGDLPAGVLFGGVLVSYTILRRQKKGVWPAVVMLAAFALVKDNTIPAVLVAAGMMAVDTLLFCRPPKGARLYKNSRLPGWLRPVGQAAGMFGAVLAAVMVWGAYASWANAQNPATGGAQTGVDTLWAVRQTLLQLFGAVPREEKFSAMLTGMGHAFFNRDAQGGVGVFQVSMVGSLFASCVLILLVFTLACVLAKAGRARWRTATAGVLSLAGFLGFLFVMLVSYSYLFKQNEGITDFGRYMSSYLPGWLALAVLLLAINGQDNAALRWRPLAAKAGVLALCCGMVVQFARLVPAGYSVLDYPESIYAQRKREQALAERMCQQIEPGSRTFFVSQTDNGQRWFMYAYHFLPEILDYSGGGVTFGPPLDESPPYYIGWTAQKMAAYLSEEKCEYIFVERMDESFASTYGNLFRDALRQAADGPALYRRGAGGLYDPVSTNKGVA